MSERAVAASRSIVMSPDAVELAAIHVVSPPHQAQSRFSAACSASSALAMRRIAASLLTMMPVVAIERDVRQVRLLRQAAAVIARDVGDDRGFVVGQPEDLRCGEDVLRVLVMRAQADVNADVVQQRRHLQQQPIAIAETVLVAQFVEQPVASIAT